MKIYVRVKPNSKQEKVEKLDDGSFKISVKEPAKNGKANEAVLRTLADYFGVPISCVSIVSGRFAKQKIIEVLANRK